MLRFALALILTVGCVKEVLGQACPRDDPNGPMVDSGVRQIHGLVVLHQGIRTWMEMKPDEPVCGNTSVQLFQVDHDGYALDERDPKGLEGLRGCHVEVTGHLGLPFTGYYSAPIYMMVDKRHVDPGCNQNQPLTDFSKLKPSASVRSYRVHMVIDYHGEGRVSAVVRSGGKLLRPWQAYASYQLTGGFAFYGQCADDYSMTRVRGTRAANPGQTDSVASLDPETAAVRGMRWLYLDYTCTR